MPCTQQGSASSSPHDLHAHSSPPSVPPPPPAPSSQDLPAPPIPPSPPTLPFHAQRKPMARGSNREIYQDLANQLVSLREDFDWRRNDPRRRGPLPQTQVYRSIYCSVFLSLVVFGPRIVRVKAKMSDSSLLECSVLVLKLDSLIIYQQI